MADLSLQEQQMFSRYWGVKDLQDNDQFWVDCLVAYQDKVIVLPLVDNPASRQKLHRLLKCPPGQCGICCHYDTVYLSKQDIQTLQECVGDFKYETKENISYLDCKKGCQFLKDGVCSVYDHRPLICAEFPIQSPRQSIMADGKTFDQVQYRLKCLASLKVIREIMKEACQNMTLLPDLTLIPKVK